MDYKYLLACLKDIQAMYKNVKKIPVYFQFEPEEYGKEVTRYRGVDFYTYEKNICIRSSSRRSKVAGLKTIISKLQQCYRGDYKMPEDPRVSLNDKYFSLDIESGVNCNTIENVGGINEKFIVEYSPVVIFKVERSSF